MKPFFSKTAVLNIFYETNWKNGYFLTIIKIVPKLLFVFLLADG